MTRRAALVVAAFAVVATRDAAAERVSVEVIEIAGGLAYVEPGGRAGLRSGQKVTFGRVVRRIVEVTETTAVVQLDGAILDVGDRGVVARVTPGAGRGTRLPPPRPAELWNEQWPEPVLPASRQSPRSVPLGRARAPGRLHLAVVGAAVGSVGDGGAGEAQGRLRLSYELWQDRVWTDLDATVRLYSGGFDSRSRTPIWVRAAQLRYGSAADPRIALGRLPWAATGVGVLDGLRASARLGSLELAAFGGLVPDGLDGRPDPGTGRFGAELIYSAAGAPWQPRLGLTAYGSTWDGAVDERRALVTAGASRGGLDLDGWAEVQSFPAGNPWDARLVELTGAGLGASYRRRGRHAGVDVTALRPERSLRLDALLPADWSCARVPQSGEVPEACAGGDLWAWASASAGLATPHWRLDAGASLGTTHGIRRFVDATAFGRVELRELPRRGRVIGGGSYGRSSFVDWIGGELGIGASPVPDVDVTVSYRPELLAYVARTETWLVHTVVVDGRWTRTAELDVGGTAIITGGPDRSAATIIATVAWRPWP